MKILISEKRRPLLISIGVAIGVGLGTISQSAFPDDFLNSLLKSPFPTIWDFDLKLSNLFFVTGLILLLLISIFVEYSKDLESDGKHNKLETSVFQLGKLVSQLGVVPSPDFIGALKDQSQAFFSFDRIERTFLDEPSDVYKSRVQNALRQRLYQLAILTRKFFPEMEKANVGVNVMRYLCVKGNEEAINKMESSFIFRGPLESLSKSEGVLYLDKELAIVSTKPNRKKGEDESILDSKIENICFPIHTNESSSGGIESFISQHLPGAPEAFLRENIIFYPNGKAFVSAARNKKLHDQVVNKIDSYFKKHKNEIQSVISIPFSFVTEDSNKVTFEHRYILNIHSDKEVESGDPRLFLFESTMSPFLSSLAEKIQTFDELYAILSNEIVEKEHEASR